MSPPYGVGLSDSRRGAGVLSGESRRLNRENGLSITVWSIIRLVLPCRFNTRNVMLFILHGIFPLSAAEDRQDKGQYEDEDFHCNANLSKNIETRVN